MQKYIVSIAAAVNAVCVILLCLYVAINLPAFSLNFYRWQYRVNDTANLVSMEKDELMAVTSHMLDYMRGNISDLQIEAIVDGQPRLFFSQREILHMVDVYNLFVSGTRIRNMSMVLVLATVGVIAFLRQPVGLVLANAYRWAMAAVFAAVAAFAVVVSFNFDRWWTIFHEIFFDNDLWLLDPATELLINIVPLSFFINMSIVVGAIFCGLLLAVFGVAWLVCVRACRGKL